MNGNRLSLAEQLQALRAPALMTMLCMLIALAVGASPVARAIDGLLYDAVMRHAPGPGRPAVLLVTLAREELARTDQLLELIEEARAAGARAIGIAGVSTDAADELAPVVEAAGVVLGRTVAELSELGAARPERFGVTDIDTGEMAVARSLRLDFRASWGDAAAFSAVLAQAAGAEAPAMDRLSVNYRLDGPIPSLTSNQALGGSLIPELVQDRVVVIGPGLGADAGGFVTPLATRVSATRLHGHGVDTLLRDRAVLTLGPVTRLIALALLGLAAMLLLRRNGFASSAVTVSAIVGLGVVAAATLALADLALPFTEWIALQLGVAAAATRRRIVREDRELRELISESGHRLRQRIPNGNFIDSPEYWQQITALVDQTLELRRTLFLDRDPEDHRVREIIARRCSIRDIAERRRDFEREPYRSAIAARGPLRLEEAFLTAQEREVQYLVPLVHSGEVLGFWALSIHEESHPDREPFEAALTAFSEQIAAMLRQRIVFHREMDAGLAPRTERAGESARSALRRTIAAIERRLEIFEDVFASQQTATIVFDLFGQVVQSNPSMDALLGEIGFAPEDSTALDLVIAVTGRDESECQGLLRTVVLQRRPVDLSVSLRRPGEQGEGRTCQLTLGPVAAQSHADHPQEREVRPFELAGLMIELQDVSRVQRSAALKEELIDRVGFRLRGDSEAVVLASTLLKDETLEPAMREEISQTLVERALSASRVIEDVRGYLSSERDTQGDRSYPLDSVTVLQRIVDDAQCRAATKRVRFEIDKPTFPHLVLAEEDALTGLLAAIVSLLVEDSAENTRIRVIVQESPDRQSMRLFDEGFGIPDDRFQHYLSEAEASAGEEYLRLREARALIESWGGEFSAAAAMGTGFEFHLSLPIAI